MTSPVIVPLPGQPTSPKAFAGMLVEYGDQIVDMVCVIEWKDADGNTYVRVHNTEMKLSKAAWMQWAFNQGFPPPELREGRGGANR